MTYVYSCKSTWGYALTKHAIGLCQAVTEDFQALTSLKYPRPVWKHSTFRKKNLPSGDLSHELEGFFKEE
jgi:hypothetical protein